MEIGMDENAWHLDKKVPIGIIVALLVQTIVLVYVGTTWKVDVESRLGALEKSDARNESQEARIIIMEQQLSYIRESLRRIEGAILNERAPAGEAP
jgi:hypothetical protein